MAAVFIAQATNSHMDIWHQITLLVVLLLSSKGAAGVTGSGFIVLAATISAVGHLPVAGLALILGIDRFMSEARALTNLIGNGVATIVVAKRVRQLDENQMRAVLGKKTAAQRKLRRYNPPTSRFLLPNMTDCPHSLDASGGIFIMCPFISTTADSSCVSYRYVGNRCLPSS